MRIKIFFLLFIVLQITACNRYDLLTNDNSNIIEDVKITFLEKKANYIPNQTLNFRQSLPRTILWDQAKEGKDSSLLVPIHLTLIKDSIVRTADGAPLNGNIWLYAKKKNNDWTFTMWTLIPTNSDKTKFTGTLLSEDYFQGIVSYSNYINGKIVQNKEIIKKQNISKREKLAITSGHKMAGGWSYDCNERIYTICIGNPKDPNDSDICSTQYETTCKWNWTNPSFGDNQTEVSWIACEDCGGGYSPPDEDKVDSLIIKFTCGGDNTEFKNSFYSALKKIESGVVGNQDYGCFSKNILKAIQNKQGVLVLNVCFKSKDSGPNGTYDPKTKTMGFIYESVNDMTTLHELIHYYQDFSGHYPNMSAMAGGNKGFSNLEFETRLLLDIMKGYGDEYINELINGKLLTAQEVRTIRNDYEIFIKSFRDANNNLINPNTIDKSNFNTQYQSFLTLYSTKSKNYKSEIDSSLEPKVFDELLKFIFNNCN